jgi:TPR repeat protein
VKTYHKIVALFFLAALPFQGSAQSVDYARALIEQGKYLEAAKQLRPLADGGNAEAQYLASDLFFNGQGVNKSEAQGIKYATLAANQGHKSAVTALAIHYRDKGDKPNYFQTLKKYTDMFPELLKDAAGILLASCYFNGDGTEKNPSEGIRIVDRNNFLNSSNIYIKYLYWRGKANLAGYSDVRAYNEAEYGAGRLQHHAVMARAIYDWFYEHELAKLREAAEKGNSWEMAHLSNMLNEPGTRAEARQWAQKAADAGSNYGKGMLQYITALMKNNNSQNTNNTSSIQNNTPLGKLGKFRIRGYRSNALDAKITRVEVGKSYTEITLVYNNTTNASQRLTINPNTHIVYNGKTYRMKRSSVPSSGTMVTKNTTYDVYITFPHIPSDGTDGFDLIENGLWKFYNITY